MSNIKSIKLNGVLPGKSIVILAGVHGNETCGVKAFDNLIPKLKILSGSVLFIYANLDAIDKNRRFVEANLNRCFFKEQSEDIRETLEGKTAREIMPYLDKADAMLDVHASTTEDSQPFAICDEKSLGEARIFDSDIAVCNFDPFEPGSTDYYMNLQSKPGFGFECGYLGDIKSEERAKKAIINFLVYCGCIEGKVEEKKEQKLLKITSLYRNKSAFKRAKYFPDFFRTNDKTLVGFDGSEEIYVDKNRFLLFVRSVDKSGEECFLVAEEIR